MHLPFTPNHIHLISACYPPSAALLAAGQEYLPNSQELSRLTYYASNRPGKINKLSNELEKKARADCRKAQAGNTRARATLLITLYIFKALATECRRDISLLTSSLMSAVKITLCALSSDLEVAARAANVFTAWTTFTDGHLIGVDRDVTQDYLACLESFSAMGTKRSDDAEIRNRTRLVGLAALTAAVNSDALFHSITQFKTQVSTMMPALLAPLLEVDTNLLEFERAIEVKEQPTSTLLDEFQTLPALERRAASIHLHVDGDKGPSSGDVTNTSLRALSSLLAHSNGSQVSTIMTAALEFLDDSGGWGKVNNCQWFAEKGAEWTQYQYRYAVPTRLVECLIESQDAPQATSRHSTLLAMITAVFISPVPLVNLSTSDIISSLITLIFRRISIEPQDGLLSPLVECIASLGTHVYYADQIQDLAGELISRLVLVNTNGLPGRATFEKGRVQAVRCLLSGLLGLLHSADMHDAADTNETDDKKEIRTTSTSPNPPSSSNPALREAHVRPSRRTRISPEIWHDTLVLLCDHEYTVRADYAVALVSYLRNEIPRLGEQADSDGIKRLRPLQEGHSELSNTMTAMIYGDATTRFLNALHAYAYALITSSAIGFHRGSPSSSPERHIDGNASAARDESASGESPRSRDNIRNSTNVTTSSRKTSIILRALQKVPTRLSPTSPPASTLSDYGNVLAILTAVHESLPLRALLTGTPMLLALDSASRIDGDTTAPNLPLFKAVKQVVDKAWVTIGKVWSCSEVVAMAEQHMSAVAELFLPSLPDMQPSTFELPRKPILFTSEASSSGTLTCLDTQALLIALASNPNVQEATGLDQQSLLRRLAMPWTAESAFRESLETRPNYDALQDALSPLIKVAPTLMHIENLSLQSLARSTRGMGVTDLREALEGRSSVSNPNLVNAAPSISTLDHTSSMMPGDSPYKLTPTRSRPQRNKLAGPEVRDMLNKLGIGNKQNGTSQLKSSFPSLQKPRQLSPAFSPPYKT
ncbi:hypothetical protein BKA93DRAFT_274079 [Sparassis latifolia]